MIRKLNFERDNNYLLLEDELFRFIRSLDPEKDTSVKIMNGRIDLYIEEQKYDLLPKEELDIQLGRILDGIKNLQTSPKEEVSQSEDKDWRQLIRGKDKLSVPFDPFLNTSNNKKVPVQLHLKRKRARLSLLMLVIESLEAYKADVEKHVNKLNKLNKLNLKGLRIEYINYYKGFLSNTIDLIVDFKSQITDLEKQIQLIDSSNELQNDRIPNLPDLEKIYDFVNQFDLQNTVEYLSKISSNWKTEIDKKARNELILFVARINGLRYDYKSFNISTFTAELTLIQIFSETLDKIESLFFLTMKNETVLRRLLKKLQFA